MAESNKWDDGGRPDRVAELRRTLAATRQCSGNIPLHYLTETIPMGRALEWLAAENAQRSAGLRLLPAALQLKAVTVALGSFPELNGWYQDSFQLSEHIHAGVAIALPDGGLAAPAIANADRKSLEELMAGLSDLVARTRAGRLDEVEWLQASVTVTILGEKGAESALGAIHPPQVALVSFGRIESRPWVVDGQIVPMPLVVAGLTADCRVSDSHRCARFLAELRDVLQRPEELALA